MAEPKTKRNELPGVAWRFIPIPDQQTRHSVTIEAAVERVWPHVTDLDVAGSPWLRLLFAARGMGRVRTVGDFEAMGFRRLLEANNRALVYGVIGRFWKPGGEIVDFDDEGFVAYDEPGYAKAVTSFDLAPLGTSTKLTTETLIACTDEQSRRSFQRYWRLIGPFSGWVRRQWLRGIKEAAELA